MPSRVYQFSRTAISKGWLNQHRFIVLESWRPEVLNQSEGLFPPKDCEEASIP